ncbi:RNA polymerase factor sigma-54 [Aquabacterium sp. A7-Y]|uniref:RNA polymerase factor sigma-54 n=1 Tax=Aquabacterium sp. A7-Y TaxID=1349605 RepID=UPI00223CB5EC|nr:RNA polymerase factor sigma-54 [Aquabacterium sp. A7-Y]MCW7536380.1 RNA polymerase factor sigma-54 [Aquabacterium sp. A7-Y]
MNAPVIRLEHRQHQTLTPRLQQAVRLLQLSSLDFAQEVNQAVGSNPFLEEDSDAHATPQTAPDAAAAEPAATWNEVTPVSAPAADTPWDRESWGSTGGGSGRGGSGDGDLDLVEMVAADISLRQHLHSQINVMPLSQRDRTLAGTIIEALDDDGYLRLTLEELQGLVECSPAADDTEMNVALKLVQSLDPSGIAARDVRECLLLQLKDIQPASEQELACRIVGEHLDRLATRDVNGLARALGASVAQVEAVCERIRHLDPRPGWRFGPSNTQFVTPDVIVRKVRGIWTATLNPDVIPKVRLNQVYAELFQRHRDSGHSELAAHLQEARWTVRNVEQRFATILHVAQAIVKRQRHFLEYGALAMKPLGLREIAEELGLHESTVSRVTNNKYMATPLGVFELKYFFSRALPTVSGGSCSATAIRGVIKDMIEAEDAMDPLSDAQIARQLARQGLSVARRTVTKYRQMMRLPSVEKRRKHV